MVSLFVLFAVFLLLASGEEAEVSVGVDGEAEVVRKRTGPAAMEVSVVNRYEHDVDVYYVRAADNAEVLMGTLGPGEEYHMNTFTGHSFAVKRGGAALSTVGTCL